MLRALLLALLTIFLTPTWVMTQRPVTSSCDAPAVARGTYVNIDVAIPGAESIQLRAINERRDIVGWYSGATGSPTHSFLLRRGQVTLIAVPGAAHTWANDINAAGVVVGAYWNDEGEHAFVWADGEFTLYPKPPGSFSSLRFGAVNASGAIAGHFNFEENGTFGAQAFVLRQGTLVPLDAGGFPWAFPVGINERGDVLLTVQPSAPGPGRGSYLLATRHGVETVTGCPGLDSFRGQLWAVTNQGHLAGRMGTFTAFSGVVYLEQGVRAYNYPGAVSTELVDINSAGYAIGHAGIADFQLTQPFLFVPQGRQP
jgi:probable HAF family extracellular repeat protein